MYINVNKKWQLTLEILMIILGTFIMGFSFSIFLEPNNISTGGFSGLAMIISHLLGLAGIGFLSSSIIYLILNIGLFVYAYKAMGRSFAIKALIGILSFSISMEVFAFLQGFFVYENIVSAIFGGVLMGVGIGLVVRFGGSTGGSDMIACVLKKKRPNLTIGKIVIIIDIIVVGCSIFVFNNGLALLPYTIFALSLCSVITDMVNEGYREVRAYNIITSKPEELSAEIMKYLLRGCTLTKVKGMYNQQDKACLLCLISKYQSAQLKNIIRRNDPTAFVFSMRVSEVVGEWSKDSEIQENNENNKLPKKEKNKTSKE